MQKMPLKGSDLDQVWWWCNDLLQAMQALLDLVFQKYILDCQLIDNLEDSKK